MNVLLTSVGRRSYLVRYFQEALRGRGVVVATNSIADVPGMEVADYAELVPDSCHPEYPELIVSICKRFDIGLLCSLHDLDVIVLASIRERLHQLGVSAMLPDPDWARICLDKFACGARLSDAGFSVPWTSISQDEARAALRSGELSFPIVIKARFGFGSLGLHICDRIETFDDSYARSLAKLSGAVINSFMNVAPESAVLFQEHISGEELCLDIVNDLNGCYAGHFACQVHAMRAGESDRATTVESVSLEGLARRFSGLTQHHGIWGIDIMVSEKSNHIIDVNPRFTGDYPFQHLAGSNVPAALLAWAGGHEFDPAWLRPEPGITGFKDLVPVRAKRAAK